MKEIESFEIICKKLDDNKIKVIEELERVNKENY